MLSDSTETVDVLTPAAVEAIEALSIEDTARALSVSRATINRLLAAGELPSFSIGRARRIPRNAVVDFVQRRIAAAS